MNKIENNRNFAKWLFPIILFACSILYFAVLTPQRFGAYHDDSIYATTAKAIATGQGYRIISLPYEPAQTKYPPFYPLLLSLIWKAHSQFPGNLVWMMLLSVAATLGFLGLTYRYLTRHSYATNWQALIIVALVGINWRTIILATGMYSEMFYAALSVAALHLAEQDADKKADRIRRILLGIALGLAFFTRTSGIVLLIAVSMYYALRKRWGSALSVMSIGGLFVLGWVAWCYANNTSAEGINSAYYTSYLGHLKQSVSDMQAHDNTSALTVYFKIIFTNLIGGVLVSVPLVCSSFNDSWVPSFPGSTLVSIFLLLIVLLGVIAGFVRQISKGLRLLHIYILSSFAIYLFWLPGVAYDRFIMPLLPFLLLFAVRELGTLISLSRNELRLRSMVHRKVSAALILVISLAVVSINFYYYGAGIFWSMTSARSIVANRAAEDAAAFNWLEEKTNSSSTLVCYRDPKYFLYTGHKAVRSFPMTEGFSWEEDQASMDKLAQAVFRIIDEADAKYLVVTPTDFELEDRPDQHRRTFDKLIEQHPQTFLLVFESPGGGTRIYRTDK